MSSIAQRCPRLIVLILDGCREFTFDEPLADAKELKHGLDIPADQKLKAVPDTVIAHSCAPNTWASDSGKYTTETDTGGGSV